MGMIAMKRKKWIMVWIINFINFIVFALLLSTAATASLLDTDEDGIWDVFELYGYYWLNGSIDFPGMGASPYKKDIFIEVDVMTGVTVAAGALQDVIDAFASAPVLNPDGTIGINVHIDASGSVPFYDEIDFGDHGGHRINPRIDVNASGRIAVCWQDDEDKNGYYEIRARIFNADGTAATNQISVNDESDGQQKYPDIAQDSSGEFVVVWQDDRDGNGYYEIYGRVFDASGNALTTSDIHVNSTSDGQQFYPAVGMDSSGNWIAAWQDDRDGNDYYDIYARRFDKNGNALTAEISINPVGDRQQKDIELAMASDGRAVIVWEDDRDGNDYYEIYARRLNANGTTNGDEIHVNSTNDGQQLNPSVAIRPSADFVVAWQDDRDGNGYYEIYARRFRSNGSANGGEIHVNSTSDGQQEYPSIAMNNNGRFTVAWQDDRDGNGYYEIYARTFNSGGDARTGEVSINTDSTDQQQRPAVGMADDGDYTVAYQDDRDQNDLWKVYIRIMDQNGNPLTSDVLAHPETRSFSIFKENYFTKVREGFYHYCIVANRRVNTGSSGVGDRPGDDFIVSLGLTPSRTPFAGTFMHELGHNLNLQHGGFEGENYKPNYMSIMRYGYQFWGADDNCDAQSSSSDPGSLNYSLGRKFNLNENSLDERLGICNGEVDVNWVSAGQQQDVDVDASDGGRFIVVWEDDRDKNDYYEIYARPYDSNGSPLSNEIHVNPTSSGQQRDPAVGIAENGNFVVVWEDDRNENGYYEIYAQRFNASGSANGGEISVNADESGDQRNPDLAVASDGAFVVVWEDDRNNNGYYEIYARLFNSSGTALTGDVHVNPESSGQQYKPRVEIADDHRFVVVWEDDRNENGYYQIYARRFASSGSANGGEILVNPTSAGQQRRPDVGVASDGRFVVVWEDDRNENGYYQIYARRFNANGAAAGGEFVVNQESGGQQRYPRVVSNDNFEFAIVWQDDRDDNGYYQIYARPYNSSGAARAAEQTINPVSGGQQIRPDVGIDSSARFYIAWQDDRDDNGYYEIFALRASATGGRRDQTAIDWDSDGNSNESSMSADINNADGEIETLKDYNDWENLKLDF